jgi:hypothetical protein
MRFDTLIDIVDKGYPDGLFKQAVEETHVGDGLAEFISQKLMDTFEGNTDEYQINEATRVLEMACKEINGVVEMLKDYKHLMFDDYRMVIDEYLGGGIVNTRLNKYLLKRIEDHDLPLFLHYDWEDDDLKDEFIARLKGIQ